MTRGKFTIINDKGVYTSYEFNGDMYYDGHGSEVVERLKRVENEKDFVREVEEFNAKNFEYNGKFNKPFFIEKNMNFSKEYFDKYFSDYVYVKNITDETHKIVQDDGTDVEIEPNQNLIFYFGSREEYMEEAKNIKE